MTPDVGLLDDPAWLLAADPHATLPGVASGAAQVREAVALAAEAGAGRLADEDRPRAVVICGAGGAALCADIVAAVAGPQCRVPVVAHRGHGLPLWVGAADLVMAVSGSGSTPQTLSALEEAVRRGSRLLAVGPAGSPLEALGRRGRGLVVAIPRVATREPLWSLTVPLLVAGDALGLLRAPAETLAATAVMLETTAARCQPHVDTVSNPAKTMAATLTGTLPLIWGTTPPAGAAAGRFAQQLAVAARRPALHGTLPDVVHDQALVLDRAAEQATSDGDFFRDRADDGEVDGRTPLHLVLLRDTVEPPEVAAQARLCVSLARARGVEVSEVLAEGSSPVERIASLVGLADWASVYLALLEGTDPTPVGAVTELQQGTTG